ncbi:MAG TPA: YdcF family protein [Stellaceae bacterium]|nr:YdcF family protein [Stellaceae bacterium]
MRRTALLLLILGGAWAVGLGWFVAVMEAGVVDTTTPTDAIVVLTGGSRRIESGLHLLVGGKAKKLFISGVHQGVETAEMLKLSRDTPQWVACCVVLGHAADNTVGNAVETAAWLRQEDYRSIRLVTANYHMPRALLEFSRVLPDVTVIANPVVPEGVRQDPWWAWRGPVYLIVVEYTKYLVALARPLLPSNPLRDSGGGDPV